MKGVPMGRWEPWIAVGRIGIVEDWEKATDTIRNWNKQGKQARFMGIPRHY
jgi:hypothetical protein